MDNDLSTTNTVLDGHPFRNQHSTSTALRHAPRGIAIPIPNHAICTQTAHPEAAARPARRPPDPRITARDRCRPFQDRTSPTTARRT
eukprot:11221140-Lingulodinium_polyedra.AAC.1